MNYGLPAVCLFFYNSALIEITISTGEHFQHSLLSRRYKRWINEISLWPPSRGLYTCGYVSNGRVAVVFRFRERKSRFGKWKWKWKFVKSRRSPHRHVLTLRYRPSLTQERFLKLNKHAVVYRLSRLGRLGSFHDNGFNIIFLWLF